MQDIFINSIDIVAISQKFQGFLEGVYKLFINFIFFYFVVLVVGIKKLLFDVSVKDDQ